MDRQRLLLATSLILAAASVSAAGYEAWLTMDTHAPVAWWRPLIFAGFIGLPALVLVTLGRQWRAGTVLLTVGAANPASRPIARGLLLVWSLLAAAALATPSQRLAAPFFCALTALYLPQAWGRAQLRECGIATGSGLIPWKLVDAYNLPDPADAQPVASIHWKTGRRDHTLRVAVAPEYVARFDEILSARTMPGR